MLPGMESLLAAIPGRERKGWITNPLPITGDLNANPDAFHPTRKDLAALAIRFSNCSIAKACGVSEMTVRNWLVVAGIVRAEAFKSSTGKIPQRDIAAIRLRAEKRALPSQSEPTLDRLTKEQVGRVIAMIGKEAGVVVQQADSRTGHWQKSASAHDLRRRCTQRLINLGVSAEALTLIMRHSSLSITEKHYGELRSAQSAATEVAEKLAHARKSALVGRLMVGTEEAPQLSVAELLASLAELREDRDEFDLYLSQQDDHLIDEQGVRLQINRWKYAEDTMSKTRLQDEYNHKVRASDIVVSLFKTLVEMVCFAALHTSYNGFQFENVAAWPTRWPLASTRFQMIACSIRNRFPELLMRMPR